MGDRPCSWHKKEMALCYCEHYSPIRKKILLIKLDAMGDVLRTTCILPVLRKEHPDAQITWITRQESVPLLLNNPYIDEILPFGSDAMVHLASCHYDRVINLDAGKISSGLASIAKSREKVGFVLHPDGYVQSTNQAAHHWLETGLFDDLKKENTLTYQEVICSIIGIPDSGMRYVMELDDGEKRAGVRHLSEIGLDPGLPTIGIHTGGGDRWVHKQWTEDGFVQLINEVDKDLRGQAQIILFGGPSERERNARIMIRTSGKAFDAGINNPVRHFASMVAGCTVVLTGDSLAMHVALAMGKRTVVIFGPTSFEEIEMFGLGEKVIPHSMDCLVCYLKDCVKSPNCMEMVSVGEVKEAVLRQLELAGEER